MSDIEFLTDSKGRKVLAINSIVFSHDFDLSELEGKFLSMLVRAFLRKESFEFVLKLFYQYDNKISAFRMQEIFTNSLIVSSEELPFAEVVFPAWAQFFTPAILTESVGNRDRDWLKIHCELEVVLNETEKFSMVDNPTFFGGDGINLSANTGVNFLNHLRKQGELLYCFSTSHLRSTSTENCRDYDHKYYLVFKSKLICFDLDKKGLSLFNQTVVDKANYTAFLNLLEAITGAIMAS